VREFCRGRLAPYKVPVKIEVDDQVQYSARFKKMRTQQS
jgi:long-chain acyl-CoA synthetase